MACRAGELYRFPTLPAAVVGTVPSVTWGYAWPSDPFQSQRRPVSVLGHVQSHETQHETQQTGPGASHPVAARPAVVSGTRPEQPECDNR
jgi:hypothetical protein